MLNEYPNRFYSAVTNSDKIGTSMLYAYSSDLIRTGGPSPHTGNWGGLQMTPDGALKVAIDSGISIDSINISGLVVNTDQLEIINTSGVQYLQSINGAKAIDSANGYAVEAYLKVGGRAVEVASGFNPGYTSGGAAEFNISRDNGSLLVQPTDLNSQYDSVTAYSPQSTTVSNSSISGSFAATALQTGIALYSNTGRKSWFVQNTSASNPLYIRFSASPASTGLFNVVLNPSSSAGLGGGSFTDDSYLGAVSISGTSCIIWELT